MAKVRVLSFNFRKSTINEIRAEREWDHRWPYARKYLLSVAPAVVGAQECTVDQCDDVMSGFPNWTYAGGVRWGNVPVFWDATMMHAEEGTLLERKYPSGERERYATIIRLTHTASGQGGWFGSIHLSANGDDEPNSPKLRAAQMTAIINDFAAWISQHPYPDDAKPNLIVCGDLNDDLGDTHGVRKIASNAGWKPLRTRLSLAKIAGDTYRSFNAWGRTSQLPRDSRWIDEIFTSGVTLEDAALRRTCKDIFPICCSDHNGASADVILGPDKELP